MLFKKITLPHWQIKRIINSRLSLTFFMILLTLMVRAISTNSFAQSKTKIIHITAKKFEFSPSQVVLKKNEPVILELTTLDRKHGFKSHQLGFDALIKPGDTTKINFTPKDTGTFVFECSVFCGSGHEDMSGTIIVK